MKKVEIKLHGILAKEVGRRFFNLAVSSVSEAIHAINILTSNKLNKVLNKYGQEKFNVVINGRKFSHNKFLDPKDTNIHNEIINSELSIKTNTLETIDIVPVFEASDSDIFAIILGVVLIIVGAFVPGLGVYGAALIVGGIGIAAAGIINLLSKPPSFEPFQEFAGATKKSYLFNGPENVIGEGGPVPVGYGRLTIGSQTVSASYDIYNVPIDNGIATAPNNEDVVTAWYFNDNETFNFNDKISKINYKSISKLAGRDNISFITTPGVTIRPIRFNVFPNRPSQTWELPQEALIKSLMNLPSSNNNDPILTININDLTEYEVTRSKDANTITEPFLSKKFDIKIYCYQTLEFSIGSCYINNISGGTFDNLEKYESSGPSIISSSSILYPYTFVRGSASYVTLLNIKGFTPTNDTFTIELKNNSAIVPVTAIVVEKSIKNS